MAVADVASTFHSTLDPVSFKLTSTLTEEQRVELAVEVQFYGLLRRMMPTAVPYYAQEQTGEARLRCACVAGTDQALRVAVAQARELVVEMGSTTPWLTEEFQDARYAITDRVVNNTPVWAAENGELFMFRDDDGRMWIGREASCAAGKPQGSIFNAAPAVFALIKQPANAWRSAKGLTLGPQFSSAGGTAEKPWVWVPNMRVAAVHGLDDGHPAMAAALRQLAALREHIGVALLRRACVAGTKDALQSAVGQARELVVEMRSTTLGLSNTFQDARYTITDRVVNGIPVWAAENGAFFMYRANDGRMWISSKANCAAGEAQGIISNTATSLEIFAPCQLPTTTWRSRTSAMLNPQHTSAGEVDANRWVWVPGVRVRAVHGLDDGHPAMAAALRRIAALVQIGDV